MPPQTRSTRNPHGSDAPEDSGAEVVEDIGHATQRPQKRKASSEASDAPMGPSKRKARRAAKTRAGEHTASSPGDKHIDMSKMTTTLENFAALQKELEGYEGTHKPTQAIQENFTVLENVLSGAKKRVRTTYYLVSYQSYGNLAV